MQHLGNLKGSGTLRWGAEALPVTYRIDVIYSPERRTVSGSGNLSASEVLFDALTASNQTLDLESGETIGVVLTSGAMTTATFSTVGPIPGGWEKMVR